MNEWYLQGGDPHTISLRLRGVLPSNVNIHYIGEKILFES